MESGPGGGIQRSCLVWVLAVPQARHFVQRDAQPVRQLFALSRATQVSGYCRIVLGDMAECLGGQSPPVFVRQAAIGDLVSDPLVVRRIHDHGHRREVLGRCPEHRRPSDVDVLEGVVQRYIRFADGLDEGIQVDRDKVDGLDPVLLQFGHLVLGFPARQQAPVDDRVQRLDPAIEDFRRTRDLGHLAHVQSPFLSERPVGAAGADQVVASLSQPAPELHHAGLVVNTD